MKKFKISVPTATLSVFDPVLVSQRHKLAKHWWQDPWTSENVDAMASASLLFFTTANKGEFEVSISKTWPQEMIDSASGAMLGSLYCASGQLCIGSERHVPGLAPETLATTKNVILIEKGSYEICMIRRNREQLEIYLRRIYSRMPVVESDQTVRLSMQYWEKIEQWMRENCDKQLQCLNPPASEDKIEKVESILGLKLPSDIKQLYTLHNGQSISNGHFGFFCGLYFSSLEQVIQDWRTWLSVSIDGMNEEMEDVMYSFPENFVKRHYTNTSWVPLLSDHAGNHIGIDYDPDQEGTCGQIIIFGRDEDTKQCISKDFSGFLSQFYEDLEKSGHCQDGTVAYIKDGEKSHYFNRWYQLSRFHGLA